MFVRDKIFRKHTEQDEASFAAGSKEFAAIRMILNDQTESLKAHDENVDAKHLENKAQNEKIIAAQAVMQSTLDDIVKLRPALEAGIAVDVAEAKAQAAIEARKAQVRAVIKSVLATAAVVGGLFPILQWLIPWLMTMHVHFG